MLILHVFIKLLQPDYKISIYEFYTKIPFTMKNRINCYLKFILFAQFFILVIFRSFAQITVPIPLIEPPKVVSPNAASIDRFTEIPVNLFTGIPNISIPIYVLKYGKISVPIALSYHPASVRPAQQPGWVGLGWNLDSYGIITRKVRGVWDDLYGDPGNQNTGPTKGYNSYYPVPGNSTYFSQSGSDLANGSDWDSQTRLETNFSTTSTSTAGPNDVLADEFSFNFMGYSGTFYYSGQTLGWQVVSNDNIKVQLNSPNNFLSANQIISAVGEFQPFQQPSIQCTNCPPLGATYQMNQFSGFTLTVPDGTQYVFGGVEATEFESAYTWVDVPHVSYQFVANAWLLTKIIDPQNHEVDFSYQRTYPTCQLFFSQEDIIYNTSNSGGCTSSESSFGQVSTTTHSGYYQWPMYLSKIYSPNESITFNISDAICLRYPNVALSYRTENNDPGDAYDPSYLHGDINNLRWEKLNNIVVQDNSNNIYRQYAFNYSNSNSQRLTLNSFSENDNNNNIIKQYTFDYNNVANMTNSMDGDYVDHWGFFNGKSVQGETLYQVNSTKQTDPNLVTTGLLNQIVYPTGGYVQLNWEAHDYARVVNVSRNAINNVTTAYAGGCRIKEIKSYDQSGILLNDKNFYYKTGYTAGANANLLSSSGILNAIPTYTFSLNNRMDPEHGTTVSVLRASLNSIGEYGYNGQGSYIGYDEVAEVNADGSYTKHLFTSYGNDINNIPHWDILPTGYLGWILSQDTYFPMSSLELERGKPIGTFEYTPTNTLVQKTIFSYRNDQARFNNYVKLIELGGCYGCIQSTHVLFEAAIKQFTYDYYPISKTTTIYDQNGNSPVVTTESYSYNSNNLINLKTATNSKGQTVSTYYKYPTDYSDAISQAMTNAHIFSPVIETSTAVNGVQQSLEHTNYFTPSNAPGIYVPQNLQLQVGSNTIETRQQFYQYDTYGNIQEMSNINDKHEVYLWSYNGEYLVAKIVGSTYSAVSAIVNQTQIDAASSNDANLRALMQTLRSSSPSALVTSYTYLPLVGMTSETDPQGRTTYYEYDSFQRLKLIRDYNNNIIKTYNYQYGN